MKHHKFTQKEREELLKNPNISKVLNSNIEFTEEFKQKVLYEHKELGKTANQIFKEAGIPDWLNITGYAKTCIKRWKYQQKHPNKEKRGRPKIEINKPLCEMNQQELIREIQILRLENDFLKKLEPLEQYKHKN